MQRKSLFGIALIQLKVEANKADNLNRAEQLITKAFELYNPQLIVLPEFFNAPINLETIEEYSEDVDDSESVNLLKKLAKKMSIDIIGGSIPIWTDSSKCKSYNTCFCIDKNGNIKTIYRKTHLFDVSLPGKWTFLESSKICPGDMFGIFETDYAKFGIGICYDVNFAEYALSLKKFHNVDMIIYPSAFESVTGALFWELFARARALDNQVYVALCSPSRNNENPTSFSVYGHSIISDPFGVVVASTGFEESIVYCKIDLNINKEISTQIPIWNQQREDIYGLEIQK